MSILFPYENPLPICSRRPRSVDSPASPAPFRRSAPVWILGFILLAAAVVRAVSVEATPDATLVPIPDPTATHTPIPGTSAPAAADLPDLRFEVDRAGSVRSALDLDDYAVDADDRSPTTSSPAPLNWEKGEFDGFDFVGVGPANQLQVTIGAQNSPAQGTAVLHAVDSSGNEISTEPIRIHTSNLLIGAPLVDEQLFIGGEGGSIFPFAWSLGAGQGLQIATPSFGATGTLSVAVMKGLETTDFLSESSLVSEASHASILNPHRARHSLLGFQTGGLSDPVDLAVGGLTIQASSTGLEVQADSAFADWVYLSVTQEAESGSKDCYTLALGDLLLGTTENLAGSYAGDSTITAADQVYGFENITMTDFLGAPNAAAYEANPGLFNDQKTSWIVSAVGQNGESLAVPGFGNASLGEISLTNVHPTASYPGAASGQALRIDLDQPDICGILLQHKGLDPQSIEPGDVLTLSVNLFINLNYGGNVSDASINQNSNGPTLGLALGTQPLLESVNYNFISFPFYEGFASSLPGAASAINPAAVLHGKWTRHEVSFRVPESGVDVQGPAGTGNIAFPNSVTAMILIARVDTALTNHTQTIYLDNIGITKIPGSLVLAQGATNVPMVSAGWAFLYENGISATSAPATGAIPASITRGQVIYGNFSDGAPSNGPTAILSNAANVADSQFHNNAAAGWLTEGGNTALAFIAKGGPEVALNFPTLASGAKSLALAPSPDFVSGNYPNPNTIVAEAHPGAVNVITPYLDMRIASNAVNPGLRVDDVVYPGDSITGNVSGVFGVRFFHRTNATNVSQNPALSVRLSNADVNLGLVAGRLPNVLTAGNNSNYSGTVWIDDMISGNIVTFSSNQRRQQLTNASLITSMESGNPSNQLASIGIQRGGGGFVLESAVFLDHVGFNAYQSVYGRGAVAGLNAYAYPGRYSTATVFVDEISLHAVRDDRAFYDAELCLSP